MKMDQIELSRAAAQPVKHRQVVDQRILARIVEAQRLLARWFENCRGTRIPACKQRHLVTAPDQFLGKVVDDAFGAAVEAWRTAFVKRANLCDLHFIEQPFY